MKKTEKEPLINHTPMGTIVNTPKFSIGDKVKAKIPFYTAYSQYNTGDEFVIVDVFDDGMYKVETITNRYISVDGENLEKV